MSTSEPSLNFQDALGAELESLYQFHEQGNNGRFIRNHSGVIIWLTAETINFLLLIPAVGYDIVHDNSIAQNAGEIWGVAVLQVINFLLISMYFSKIKPSELITILTQTWFKNTSRKLLAWYLKSRYLQYIYPFKLGVKCSELGVKWSETHPKIYNLMASCSVQVYHILKPFL